MEETTKMNGNNNRKRGSTITGIIACLFFGVAFMIASNAVGASIDRLKNNCTKRVEAEIVGFEESRDSEGDRTYSPIVGYYYDGRYYEETPYYSSSNIKDKWDVGEELKIKVNPDNPKEFYSADIYGYVTSTVKIAKIASIVSFAVLGLIILRIVIKALILCGAFGIAASQTKKFDQQQAQFYGQQQWNQMNNGQTIYTDDLNNQMNQMNPNYQQPQQGQMYNQQQAQQQGQGLNGLGNVKF